MTQFLLAEFAPALPPGFRAVAPQAFAGEAAATLFPDAASACEIVPHEGTMDAICDDARTRLHKGAQFGQTQLADVLEMLARAHCAFAMFWGNDISDLPLPPTIEELMRDVEQQLMARAGNWEIYVRWHGRA